MNNFNISWFQKKIHWTKESPYNEITSFEQYENPGYFFGPGDVTDKIRETHSIRSDLYWIKKDYTRQLLEKTNDKTTKRKREYYQRLLISIWKRFINLIGKALLFLLGSLSGGFFWSRNFRTYILSFGVKREVEVEDEEIKIEQLLTRIHMLENELMNVRRHGRKSSDTSISNIDDKSRLRSRSSMY